MKNEFKNVFIVLLAVVFILFLGTTIVNAESVSNKLSIKSYDYTNTPLKFPYTFHVKKTTSGKYVYCTTYANTVPNSKISYSKGSKITDNGMNYILIEAYKNVNSDKDFFVYQTALWIYMQDQGIYKKTNNVTTFKNTVNNSSSATAKKIKSLVSSAKKASSNDISSPSVKLSGSNIKFTKSSDGKNYVSSKIKLTSSEDKYKVSLTGAPKGTTYKVKGGYLYVYVPTSKVAKLKTNFKVEVSNTKTIYSSYVYKPSNNSYQQMVSVYKSVKNANDSITLTLNKTVDVKVNKLDSDTHKAVVGAKLQVLNSSNKVVDSWTSNGEAHVVSGLSEGSYTLKETQAPDGYEMVNASIKFSVDGNGEIKNSAGSKVTNLVVYNKRRVITRNVEISKQDVATAKELPGATLVLKKADGTVVDTWVSGTSSHVVHDLTAGKYMLTETIAPDGYVLSTETIVFSIDSENRLVNSNGTPISKIVMYNKKESVPGKVQIVKQNSDTHENLAGAMLEVRDIEGNVVESWTSDTQAHVMELNEGTYTLVETAAPKGYILNNSPIVFKISSDGKVTDESGNDFGVIILDNKPEKIETKVSISKQDATNGEELPGAHLVVRDSNDNIVDSWVSGDTPHIITGLEPGNYTLTETIAPDGYILSEEAIEFTVNADGSTTSVVMKNSREDIPIIPDQPENPIETQEIVVPSTSSFKNNVSILLGIVTVIAGIAIMLKKVNNN